MNKSIFLRSLSAMFPLLLAGVFTLSLTACGDDDDDKKKETTPTGNYMKIDGKVKNIRWSAIHWEDTDGLALEMVLSDEKIDLATQEYHTDTYLFEDDVVIINVHSRFFNQNMDLTKDIYIHNEWYLGIGLQGEMYWPDENDFKNGTLTVNQLSDTKFKVTGKGTTKKGNTFELSFEGNVDEVCDKDFTYYDSWEA